MYPETDIPPFRIDESVLERARMLVPEKPEEKVKKYVKWGLSEDLAKAMLRNPNLDLFEELVKKYPSVQPTLIANILENYIKYAKSKGGNISKITDEVIEKLVKLVAENKIVKDAVQDVIVEFTTTDQPLDEIVKKFSILSDEELRSIVRSVIEENKNLINDKRGFNAIMGRVMSKVRGRADAKKVAEIINEELKNLSG